MSISDDDDCLPNAPPPPLCTHKPNDNEPLLPHENHSHGLPHAQQSAPIDLEAGSRSRARTLAIIGTIAVLVAGVVRRYSIASGCLGVTILIVLIFYSALAALVLFIGGILGVLYNAGDQAVFCPYYPPDARHCVMLPSSVGLPSENLRLYAQDGTRLHAVFVGQPEAGARRNAITFLYFHGNAGNLGHRLANVCGLFNRLKCNILLLEYRGYGFSSGNPSEWGLYQDAAASLAYLHTRQDIDHSKIVVFGRSLGGAVGIELASRLEGRQQICALIVENTFTSIPDMLRALLPTSHFLHQLPLCCYKNKFLSRIKMLRTVVPTLVVSGQRDNLVPPFMALQLLQACGARHKRMVRFISGQHNDTWRCPGYYLALKCFIDSVINGSRPSTYPEFPVGVSWVLESSTAL